MRTESTPGIVPTEIVLEVALQVEQARLEALGDSMTFSSHEIDDTDFLSDLNDLTMEDAYRDVGLFFMDLDDHHDCLDVSQVKDTPMSENLNVHNDESENVQLTAQQVKIHDGSALGSNNCQLVYPILDHPTEKNLDSLAAAQLHVDASSSPACLSENAERENGVCSLVNKFRSRWLGGLAVKHGGGQVFKTLQRLFQSLDAEMISSGAIVAKDESKVSLHLKHCASERKLAIVPASWIAKSLHLGQASSSKRKRGDPDNDGTTFCNLHGLEPRDLKFVFHACK